MDHGEKRNCEGYSDPTAFHALENIEADKRARDMIRVVRYVIRHSGFELVENIHFRDKKTGRIYK